MSDEALSNNQLYPRIQIRVDKQTKEDFQELAQLRGTTVSDMLKSYIQQQVASLCRERRMKGVEPLQPGETFLD